MPSPTSNRRPNLSSERNRSKSNRALALRPARPPVALAELCFLLLLLTLFVSHVRPLAAQNGNEDLLDRSWASGYSSPDMLPFPVINRDTGTGNGGQGFLMANCYGIPGAPGSNQSPVAHWTGSEWIFPRGQCPTGTSAVAHRGGRYYFGGGTFTPAPNSITGLAYLDNGQWRSPTLGPLVGSVEALSVDSLRNLYVAGTFVSLDGQGVSNIAYLNGSNTVKGLFDQGGLVEGTDGTVLDLYDDGGALSVVGTFTTAGGEVISGAARWRKGFPEGAWDGLPGMSTLPGPPNRISGSGSRIWASGNFSGGGLQSIAYFDIGGNQWFSPGDPSNIGFVSDIEVTGGNRVLAMGDFSAFGDPDAGLLGEYFMNTWISLPNMDTAYDTQPAFASSGRVLAQGSDIFVFSPHDPETDPRPVFHSGITRFDGVEWHGLGHGFGRRELPGRNDWVDAIKRYDGQVFVGGQFKNAGDVRTDGIAYWVDDHWRVPGDGFQRAGISAPAVRDLAKLNGTLYAAGCFDASGGTALQNIARWTGSSWVDVGGGIDLGTAGCMGTITEDRYHLGTGIYDLQVHAGQLYAAGGSLNVNLDSNVYVLSQGSWNVVGGGTDFAVTDMASLGNKLYIGGFFRKAGQSQVGHIAAWNGSNWETLDGGVASGASTSVTALATTSSNLYAGGTFSTIGGRSANNIARWDGQQWHALGGGVNGKVFDLLVSGSDLYVAGDFTQAGSVVTGGIARWDGSQWHPLGTGLTGDLAVLAGAVDLEVIDGKLWIGGNFDWAGHKPSDDLAIWDGGLIVQADGFESASLNIWSRTVP